MSQNQMWIVQVNKQQYLDERKVLATPDKLTEIVATFTQLYGDWKEGDFILIKPTEMTYCG
jgi:hypothetical protein